jgi:DNA polymerase zeta
MDNRQCSFRILFRTQDLSAVKGYCYDAWYKIIDQRVTVQDFIFAKEVKMGTYSDKNVPAPGVTVAARRELVDPNDEVQYGERVSYVIVRGAPGTKLLERAYDPREVVTDS